MAQNMSRQPTFEELVNIIWPLQIMRELESEAEPELEDESETESEAEQERNFWRSTPWPAVDFRFHRCRVCYSVLRTMSFSTHKLRTRPDLLFPDTRCYNCTFRLSWRLATLEDRSQLEDYDRELVQQMEGMQRRLPRRKNPFRPGKRSSRIRINSRLSMNLGVEAMHRIRGSDDIREIMFDELPVL